MQRHCPWIDSVKRTNNIHLISPLNRVVCRWVSWWNSQHSEFAAALSAQERAHVWKYYTLPLFNVIIPVYFILPIVYNLLSVFICPLSIVHSLLSVFYCLLTCPMVVLLVNTCRQALVGSISFRSMARCVALFVKMFSMLCTHLGLPLALYVLVGHWLCSTLLYVQAIIFGSLDMLVLYNAYSISNVTFCSLSNLVTQTAFLKLFISHVTSFLCCDCVMDQIWHW